MKTIHGNDEEMENIESETVQALETFKCKICDFTTTHQPGLKSHVTKMHEKTENYPCDLCCEKFSSKKKLKTHIYCVHSGKNKTLAQLIDEAVP